MAHMLNWYLCLSVCLCIVIPYYLLKTTLEFHHRYVEKAFVIPKAEQNNFEAVYSGAICSVKFYFSNSS